MRARKRPGHTRLSVWFLAESRVTHGVDLSRPHTSARALTDRPSLFFRDRAWSKRSRLRGTRAGGTLHVELLRGGGIQHFDAHSSGQPFGKRTSAFFESTSSSVTNSGGQTSRGVSSITLSLVHFSREEGCRIPTKRIAQASTKKNRKTAGVVEDGADDTGKTWVGNVLSLVGMHDLSLIHI